MFFPPATLIELIEGLKPTCNVLQAQSFRNLECDVELSKAADLFFLFANFMKRACGALINSSRRVLRDGEGSDEKVIVQGEPFV